MRGLRSVAIAGGLLTMLSPLTRAQDPAPADPGALVLATSPELRDSGLLERLLSAFERETGVRARCDQGAHDADLRLLPVPPSEAPGDATRATVVFWTTFVVLGPKSDANRSYGEHNYHAWATGRSPLGTPSVVLTRSSASQLLREIGLSIHRFVSVRPPAATADCEKRLRGTNARRAAELDECESLEQALKHASRDSAYVLSDLAAYLRLRGSLRLDPVLARDSELRVEYRATVRESNDGNSARTRTAKRLQDWLGTEACREIVRTFRIDGERAFFLADEAHPATLRGRLDVSAPPEDVEKAEDAEDD